MNFDLIDNVTEQSDDRIVAIKDVRHDEDYLKDHFPTFPILPGVLMVETMVQAARRLLTPRLTAETPDRFVLGSLKALKYGAMVRPGESLEVEVTIQRTEEDGTVVCRGVGRVRRNGVTSPDETAASGRFTMRRVKRG